MIAISKIKHERLIKTLNDWSALDGVESELLCDIKMLQHLYSQYRNHITEVKNFIALYNDVNKGVRARLRNKMGYRKKALI